MGWEVGQQSAGRSVGGDGAAAPLAEVGDAVHALVHGRVHGEGGLDAVPARRVAPAGRRVHAPALRRVRLGAPPAAVAARPRAPPRLRRRRRRRLLSLSSVPSVLDMRVVAVVVVVPAAGFGEGSKSCEDDGEDAEDQQQLQRRAASSSSLSLSPQFSTPHHPSLLFLPRQTKPNQSRPRPEKLPLPVSLSAPA